LYPCVCANGGLVSFFC